jgi:hypothetical protein
VAGCCECGDEPSGSCSTELVSSLGSSEMDTDDGQNNEYKHHITLQLQSQLKCNKDDLFPFLSSSLLHPLQNSGSICAVADVTMTYEASDSCWRAVHCLADCRNQ